MDDVSSSKAINDDIANQDSANDASRSPMKQAKEETDYINKALQFLASASTETLGGIVIGLGACTYLVLGRIGLLLIGVIAGVVLHATWEKRSGVITEDERKQKGLDVLKRIFELRDTKIVSSNENDLKDASNDSFNDYQPETAMALNELVDVGIPVTEHKQPMKLTIVRQLFEIM